MSQASWGVGGVGVTVSWIQAHKDFAGKAPNRTFIFAKDSSHDISHDRPELIVEATVKLVDQLRSVRPRPQVARYSTLSQNARKGGGPGVCGVWSRASLGG